MKKNLLVIIVILIMGSISITGYHFHVKETDYKELYEISLQSNWDVVNFFEMIMDLDYAEKVAFFSDEHEENILNQLETYTQMIEHIADHRYYQSKGSYYVSCLHDIKDYKTAILALKQIYICCNEHDVQINYEKRIEETYKDYLAQAVIRKNAKEKQWVNYFNLDNTFFQVPVLSDIELFIKRKISEEKLKKRMAVQEELAPIDKVYYELVKEHVTFLENINTEAALVEFVSGEEMKRYIESLNEIIEQEFDIVSKLPIAEFNIDIKKCIFAMRQAEKIYLAVNDSEKNMEEKIVKVQRYKNIYKDIFVIDIMPGDKISENLGY